METTIDLHPQPRIDVHLLTLDEPGHWREECLASLAGAPIRLHRLPGIPGRVGQARAAGLARVGAAQVFAAKHAVQVVIEVTLSLPYRRRIAE